MSLVALLVRYYFKKNDDKRDAGLMTPDTVERYDDIIYGADPKWNVLDVYRPKGIDGKLPVIVSVHGGGWVYGDKERYQYYCMSLAERGFAAVNFTYGLAPQFKYPCQLKDTNDVFRWVMDHKDEYGFDTENIFAVGDSAGGHLLALYCCFLNNDEMRKGYDFSAPDGLKIKGAALNCGVYVLKKERSLTDSLMKDLLKGKVSQEKLDEISPIRFVNEKFPDCIVMTSSNDFLKEQAPVMVKKLEENHVNVKYLYYGDEEKLLDHVFHVNMRSEDAKICNDEECAYFKGLMDDFR